MKRAMVHIGVLADLATNLSASCVFALLVHVTQPNDDGNTFLLICIYAFAATVCYKLSIFPNSIIYDVRRILD